MDDKVILDFCSDVIILVDHFSNVLKFNKKAELIFKIQEKQIIGLNFFEVMKKHDITLCFSLQNLNLIDDNKTYCFEGDTLLLHPIKQKYIFHWAISRYSAKKPKKDLFILIGKDISETVSYKISLQDSRIYLKNIIENLPQYVYWKDKNLVYQGCNNRVAQYLGLNSPLEIIGKTDNDFHWNKTRVNFLYKIDKLILQQGTINVVEDAIPKEDGSINIMLTSKAPLRNDNNEIVGILGISFDITDRKKMEKELHQAKIAAEAASHAKTEFIANMSHDIRTPLTGILGIIQEMFNVADDIRPALQQAPLDEETTPQGKYLPLLKQIVETVQEDSQLLMGATDELLVLCNEILENMRLESGQLPEDVESFNLHELVEHNIELLQPVARHKKLKLFYEIDKNIPTYFNGLRNYLDRTLLNLLSNALKFTDCGFVKIKVRLLNKNYSSCYLGDNINLQILVEDSGIGIPKDKFETIFEHFSRLTPSYQGLYKGAGLGLYTVKRYIEAMNAKIRLKSKVGKGTCFIITLPLTLSDHTDREKTSVRLPKTNKSQITKSDNILKTEGIANVSILIVEDSPLAARAIQSALNRLRCASDIAENGMQAIKMVRENDYDLILMDIGLPDIDGIEATKQIRALNNPKALQVPIVALTGHANDSEKREESLAAGMQEVFSKPLPQSKLETILQQYIFKKRQESTLPPKETKPANEQNAKEIIDWNTCLHQMNGDEDCLRELLSMLAVDLKMTQDTLAKAYAIHDNDVLRAELHRVRGGVSYLTLPQLDKALAKFHEAVRIKPQDIQQLENTYRQLQEAMNAFWDTLEKKTFNP